MKNDSEFRKKVHEALVRLETAVNDGLAPAVATLAEGATKKRPPEQLPLFPALKTKVVGGVFQKVLEVGHDLEEAIMLLGEDLGLFAQGKDEETVTNLCRSLVLTMKTHGFVETYANPKGDLFVRWTKRD